MFLYPDQKKMKIGNIVLGGQPGETPPVMIGTIFYEGHKIVKQNGEFDSDKAEELLVLQQERSDETRIPYMTNVYGKDSTSLLKRLEFVAERDGNPILVDSLSYKARVEAIKFAKETGFLSRIVYNSINITLNRDEKEKLTEIGLKNVLILAHAVGGESIEDKISCLEKDGALGKGLLENVREIGAENLMMDTATTPLKRGAATSLEALVTLKARYGYPTGCGMHNAVSSWSWIKKRESCKHVDVASSVLPVLFGADFVLYGPIENARYVFDATAFVEMLVEERNSRFIQVYGLEL